MVDADEQLGHDIGSGVVRIHRKLRSADLEQIEEEFAELEESLIATASQNPALHHRIPLIKRRIAEGMLIAIQIKNGPYEVGVSWFQKVNDLGFDNVVSQSATYLSHADFCRRKNQKEEAMKTLLSLKTYLTQIGGREAQLGLKTVENELAKLA